MAKNVVRERHVRALYVNVPVPVAWLQAQLLPPAEPDVFDGKAWVSIVVDDLFKLQAPMGGGFMTLPGMNGWMMKVNALVRCPVAAGGLPVPGYQIVTLDFEATFGISGWFKKKAAMSTQKVPTFNSRFTVSCGRSGRTDHSSMDAGTPYSAVVAGNKAPHPVLLHVAGALAPLHADGRRFARFVVERPHKFLAQPPSEKETKTMKAGHSDKGPVGEAAGEGAVEGERGELVGRGAVGAFGAPRLMFASWREGGFSCAADGCMLVQLQGSGGGGGGGGGAAASTESGGDTAAAATPAPAAPPPTGVDVWPVLQRAFGREQCATLEDSWWATNPAASQCVVILQPEYTLVDTSNQPVPTVQPQTGSVEGEEQSGGDGGAADAASSGPPAS